jgi:hypothetical protein
MGILGIITQEIELTETRDACQFLGCKKQIREEMKNKLFQFPMELPLTGVQIVVEYAIREPSGENWMCFRADARLVA